MALSNAAVSDVSDVIATYTYRMGVQNGQYSLTTAIGVFSSVVSMAMLLLANWFARKYSESSIF
jgi:putative aldouronate transport system permease protein